MYYTYNNYPFYINFTTIFSDFIDNVLRYCLGIRYQTGYRFLNILIILSILIFFLIIYYLPHSLQVFRYPNNFLHLPHFL